MTTDDLRELVSRSANGDVDAYGMVVRYCFPRVYGAAYTRLRDVEDALDVAQESFATAYQQLRALRSVDAFPSWIVRMALNNATHYVREAQRRRQAETKAFRVPIENDAVDRVWSNEIKAVIDEAFVLMPERYRLAVALRYFGDATNAEIAETLLIAPKTAQKRVERGLVWLRAYFRRIGRTDLDAHESCSRYLVCPLSVGYLEGLVEVIRRMPAPRLQPVDTTPKVAAGVGMGFAALALVGAMAFPQSAKEVAPSPEGTRAMRVVLLADVKRDAVKGTPTVEKATREREIVAPGQEHVGWVPLSPWSDSTNVAFQSRYYASAPGGAVARNDHFVGKRFDPVSGTVTLELWLKPAEGRANTGFGVLLENGSEPMQLGLIHRNEIGAWRYNKSGTMTPIPLTLTSVAVRLRIVYRTEVAAYDLYVDNTRVGEWIPAGSSDEMVYVNRPVCGVYLGGGYNRVGMPVFFDEMSVTVQPTTELRAVVRDPRPPRREESLSLVFGSVNGQPLPDDRTLHAEPGEAMDGWLDADVGNASGPNADFFVVTVPGWGDRARNYESVAKIPPGVHRVRVPMRFYAPEREGTYYWWTVAGPQTDAKFLASVTVWGCGEAVWNDGNDVADWSEAEFRSSQEKGRVRAIWLDEAERRDPQDLVACGLKVVVARETSRSALDGYVAK